ncbi:MAG: amino acid ABC transporter substrate-binding protein [Streptococcaceae bacterium]|jgi:cystine transport system substrate-binding protein|nr:amino acid ABC transporter substrate-binding protein [Streptococcaceae bacterium]
MNKKLVYGLIGAVVVIAVGIFAFSKTNTTSNSDEKVLKVATEGTYAPFTYHDEKGNLTGYDVEVAKAVAKKMGYKVEFVEAPWDAMLSAFDAGKADVVFNQVGITDERKQKYLFSTPYTVSHSVLVVNKDNKDIHSIKDLKGKKAAQSLTSNYGKTAENAGAQLVSVDGFSKAAELLANGQADATLNDDVAFLDYMKQQPNASLKIVETAKEGVPSAVLIQKNEKDLQTKIDKALKELSDEGELTKISEQFFGKDISK